MYSCTGGRLDIFTRCAARYFYPMRREIGRRHAAYQPRSTLLLCRRRKSKSDHHSISRCVRIQLTSAYRLRKIIQASLAIQPELRAQLGQSDRFHLTFGPCDTAFSGTASGGLRCPEPVDSFQQLVNTTMLVRYGRHNRRFPVLRTPMCECDHCPQLTDQGLRPLPITLVDHENVADLQD